MNQHQQIIILLTSSTLIIVLLRIYYLQKTDLVKLKSSLSLLIRKKSLNQSFHFRTKQAQALWNSILCFNKQLVSAEELAPSIKNASNLSSKIIGKSEHPSSAIKEFHRFIKEQLGDRLIASAIITKKDKSKFEVSCLKGCSKRISYLILTIFEAIHSKSDWGYHQNRANSELDMSVFNIGLSLFLPLESSGEIVGAIWIGLNSKSLHLPLEKKVLIKMVCQHAASSLVVANQLHSKTKAIETDKNLLLGVSHDLRSPGNSAIYEIKNLVDGAYGNLSITQKNALTNIELLLREQNSLLEQSLEVSKPSSSELPQQSCKLTPVINSISCLFKNQSANSNVNFIVEKASNISLQIREEYLKRILSNLISNAFKFTREGEIRISFKINNSSLIVSVSDTGIGINSENKKLLFKNFSRTKEDPDIGGFGLGLSSSKMLANASNAKLWFEENPQGGTIFHLEIMRHRSEKIFFINEKKELSGIALVVDDDNSASRTNIRYLKSIFKTCIRARNISEAKDLVSSLKPQFLLLDLNLIEGCGTQLLEWMQGNKVSIPTLILTGESDKRVLQKIESEYRVKTSIKPLDRTELIEIVETLCFDSDDS